MPLDLNDLPDPEDIPGLEVDVQPETLAGDLRDAMLKRFRDLTKTWPAMTEAEQNQLAEGFGYDARRLVEETIKAMTAYDFPRAVGKIARAVVVPGDKARIECKVEFPLLDEYLLPLTKNTGRTVAIIMVDSAEFKGERAPAAVDKDQPDLPIDAQGSGEASHEIAEEAAEFEASAEELEQQTARGRLRAQREAAA